IEVNAYLDSCSMSCFIDRETVARLNLKTIQRPPIQITLADGLQSAQGEVRTVTEPLEIHLGTISEHLVFNVTSLGNQVDVVLGQPWLRKY
ncbi:hypothetical protein BDZ88DRAFT_388650, partial [Geranomyces variabilis]